MLRIRETRRALYAADRRRAELWDTLDTIDGAAMALAADELRRARSAHRAAVVAYHRGEN